MKIVVEPTQLEQSANHIEERNSIYEKDFMKLYQEIEIMSNAWQGRDNQTYTAQIQGFQKDFQMMITLMRQYTEFLRQSAKAYRSAQDDRVAQARSLTN